MATKLETLPLPVKTGISHKVRWIVVATLIVAIAVVASVLAFRSSGSTKDVKIPVPGKVVPGGDQNFHQGRLIAR